MKAGTAVTKTMCKKQLSARITDVMLLAAEKYGEIVRRVEVCQQALTSSHQDKLPEGDVDSIFNDCAEMGFTGFENTAAANLAILNACPDEVKNFEFVRTLNLFQYA